MISVIIPTHNRGNRLHKSIESVLNQTYREIEIIVVSDGSTDNTEEVVKNYQKKYNFIELISVFPNKGANNARNEGIKASKGDFIAFLDDDDEWLPTKLEKQMEVFMSNEAIGLVYSEINVIYAKENVKYRAFGGDTGDLSREILLNNVVGSTSSVTVKKEILSKSGYFDVELPAAQDYDLWIRICQLTEVGYASEPGVNYYNNIGENQISSNLQKYEIASKKREKKYKKYYERLTDEELKIKDSNNYLGLATIALRNNEKMAVFKYSWKAFRVKPSIKSVYTPVLAFIPFRWVLKVRSYKK